MNYPTAIKREEESARLATQLETIFRAASTRATKIDQAYDLIAAATTPATSATTLLTTASALIAVAERAAAQATTVGSGDGPRTHTDRHPHTTATHNHTHNQYQPSGTAPALHPVQLDLYKENTTGTTGRADTARQLSLLQLLPTPEIVELCQMELPGAAREATPYGDRDSAPPVGPPCMRGI